MSELSVEVNTKNVKLLFERAPKFLKSELANGLDHIGRSYMKRLLNERLSGPPGIQRKRGGIFHRFRRAVIMKSGKERELNPGASSKTTSSIINRSFRNPLDMRTEIYTTSKIAAAFERGGSISAGSGMMRIPLSPEAKARGPKNPISDLVAIKTGKGIFLVQEIGGKKLKFHYILKHSIPIRRKLGFYQLWADMGPRADEILQEAVQKAFARA